MIFEFINYEIKMFYNQLRIYFFYFERYYLSLLRKVIMNFNGFVI